MPVIASSVNPATRARGLFLCRVNRDDRNNAGVVKKCLGEVKALRSLGFQMDLVWLSRRGILCNEELIVEFPFAILSRPLAKYLFYLFFFHRIIRHKLDFSNYRLVYCRYELAHPQFIATLRAARRAAPAAKLLLELPTWPYQQENRGFFIKIALLLDRICAPQLKQYVDGIVHFGLEKRIMGIPAFPLRNGIDTGGIPVSSALPCPKELRFIAVGNWSYWHGLDRLLRGLASYNAGKPTWKVSVKIAGEGRETGALKALAASLGLQQEVSFYPALQGEALRRLFEESDLGVGTLGMHRKGVRLDSSLKHREYAARGIPFLLSAEDPDFPPDLPWVKYLPADDSALDLAEIVVFFEAIWSQAGLKAKIRAFAVENLSWERKFRKGLPVGCLKLLP